MRTYRASNRAPFGGFLLLLIIAIVVGAILGGILWAVDDIAHFYLVIVFPLFAGAIAGGVLALGVRAGKVRSPFLALLMGLIAGAVMFGVYHGADYFITFRGDVRDEYVKQTGVTPTDTELNQFIDKGLQTETGDTGIVGYLKFTANQGFSITQTTYGVTDDNPMVLQGNLVWGYWVVEILIAMIVAGVLAMNAAKQPFDEESGMWYGKPTRLAITTNKARKDLVNTLKDGDFQKAGGMLTTQEIKYPRTEVLLRRSPTEGNVPQTDIFLTVNYCQRRGRTVVKNSGIVSPTELDLIKRSIQQPAAQPAAVRR